MTPHVRAVGGMFGTVSACRHTLGAHRSEWMAAMCGSCLAIRDAAGQAARATLNTDAIAAAVLARTVGAADGGSRRAGPCPARGFRGAEVWTGAPAAIGAAVSLLAAGIALDDRAADGDLPLAPLTRRPARRVALRLSGAGERVGSDVGIDVAAVSAALARSRAVEARRSTSLDEWCAPVEDAYGAVFAACGLDEVGAAIGRVTLLADAVADLSDDEVADAPNPILSGACTTDEAVALVRADVAAVGASVAAVAPGSLAATLWGRGWRTGVEKALAPVVGRASCSHGSCRTHGAVAGVAAATVLMAGPFGDGSGYSGAPMPFGEPFQQRESKQRWWEGCCDGCDCCNCSCDCCCSGGDGCASGCCDCGDCCDCDCCCCCDC